MKAALNNQKFKAHIAMLVFAFLVSTSFTLGRAITFALDPAALTFLRFVAAVFVFSLVAAMSKEKFALPSLGGWLRYFCLALLLVIFFITMFEGLRWTTPLAAGAVFTLTPFMTALLALIFLRQTLTPVALFGLVLAGLASAWIIFDGKFGSLSSLSLGKGELIFLIGCAAYAGYAPAVQKLHRGGGLIYFTLWTLVAGSILLLAYGWDSIINTNWHLVSPIIYLAIGWLAIFTTAVTFYLIQYAALTLPSTKVMSYTLLIPAFVLAQRLFNGGTWPSISVLMALGVLFGATIVLQRA